MGESMATHLFARRRILSVVILFFLYQITSMAFAQSAKPGEILGIWIADDKSLKLEMFESGGNYDAHLLWGDRVVEKDGVTFKPDSKNPDPALRARSTKGIVFVKGLTWQNGSYTDGNIYAPATGKTYKCKAEVKDGKLLLHAYVGFSMLGKTFTFIRAKE